MEATVLPRARREFVDVPRRPATGNEAEALLRRSGYLALGHVTCETRDGVAHLRGRLPSYYLKQVAQSVAAGAPGVRRVINHVEVIARAGRAPTGSDRPLLEEPNGTLTSRIGLVSSNWRRSSNCPV